MGEFADLMYPIGFMLAWLAVGGWLWVAVVPVFFWWIWCILPMVSFVWFIFMIVAVGSK